MVTDFSALVDHNPCRVFGGVVFLTEVIVLRLHIHQICFTGSFFPQTSPSAHWILHCDPEIGQRLKAINYASWCVLVERRRHNAVLLSAIIPGCFCCVGNTIYFFFFQNISMLSLKQWHVVLGEHKITLELCSRFIVHYAREGTFFYWFHFSLYIYCS